MPPAVRFGSVSCTVARDLGPGEPLAAGRAAKQSGRAGVSPALPRDPPSPSAGCSVPFPGQQESTAVIAWSSRRPVQRCRCTAASLPAGFLACHKIST